MLRLSFINFKRDLSTLGVFSVQDARKFYPNFDSRRLVEWQKKSYIKKIVNGLYIFSDIQIDETTLFWISNKISRPSYISLETALSFYNLIPEGVFSITAVTTDKTRRLEFDANNFIFRSIKPELFFGYKVVKVKNWPARLAEPEKALLDYFYLNSTIKDKEGFNSLRINQDNFHSLIDRSKLESYLKFCNNKSLAIRILNFCEYTDA